MPKDTPSRYESDHRIDVVDAYLKSHLITPSHNKYYDALTRASDNSIAQGLPNISVSQSQGKYLAIQAQIARAKNVLEVGTLGGYSAIWFASAGSGVKVTSVEIDPHHKRVAEENIANAGLSDRVEVLLGPGMEVLPSLLQQVRVGTREKFDFVFIDADKENNLNYFNLAMDMVTPKACLYVDNIVRRGRLADEVAVKEQDPHVMGARAVVEGVGKDPRVDAVVIQTVGDKNYDGFLLAVVK